MSDEDEEKALRIALARMRQEHRDLDMAISAIQDAGRGDPLQIQRLKKKKLALRDSIAQLEDQLLPDIIA